MPLSLVRVQAESGVVRPRIRLPAPDFDAPLPPLDTTQTCTAIVPVSPARTSGRAEQMMMWCVWGGWGNVLHIV